MFPQDNQWQHDTFVQSLYSVRGASEASNSWVLSLAQARAEVFFSLLFGGRVVFSAGAFFDSPIAITVFGELFSTKGFETCYQDFGWRPLLLATDNTALPETVRGYLADRLQTGKGLILFREDDKNFVNLASFDIKDTKRRIGDAIRRRDPDDLKELFEPFLEQHHPERPILGEPPDAIPSLLDQKVDQYLDLILQYLDGYKAYSNLTPGQYDDLCRFKPIRAIEGRLNGLIGGSPGEDMAAELREMCVRFRDAHGEELWTHNLHEHGPEYFGRYTETINCWIDADWHSTRHRAYGSQAFVHSSPWTDKSVLDMDPEPKVSFESDMRLNESARIAQTKFGQIQWEALLRLITDGDRHYIGAIRRVRKAPTEADRKVACDDVLELLSKRVVDLDLRSDSGFLSYGMKAISKPETVGKGAGALGVKILTDHIPFLA